MSKKRKINLLPNIVTLRGPVWVRPKDGNPYVDYILLSAKHDVKFLFRRWVSVSDLEYVTRCKYKSLEHFYRQFSYLSNGYTYLELIDKNQVFVRGKKPSIYTPLQQELLARLS